MCAWRDALIMVGVREDRDGMGGMFGSVRVVGLRSGFCTVWL